MKWQFAVLEIYPDTDIDQNSGSVLYEYSMPTTGTPADWIEQELVGYCDGTVEDLVSFIPLWKILLWRVKTWLGIDPV